MNKKLLRKLLVINLITIMILLNFTFLFEREVNAAAEEGNFSSDELPYNLEVKKVVSREGFASGSYRYYLKTYILDSEGRLWQAVSGEGITQVFSDYRFSDIAIGCKHAIALDENGYLYAWGDNTFCQLGNGTRNSSDTPVAIYPTKQFKSVYCSDYSSFAIDNNGKLYAWGRNKFGEVQSYTNTYNIANGISVVLESIQVQEVPVHILTENRFKKISSYITEGCTVNGKSGINAIGGLRETGSGILALDVNGYVYGWGLNEKGQLGNYDSNVEVEYFYDLAGENTKDTLRTYDYIPTAMKISEDMTFSDIAVGKTNSILLTSEGKAYTIGSGKSLGTGSSTLTEELVQPLGFEDIVVTDIVAGAEISAFLDENNNIWTCGDNEYGQLGNGTTTDSATVVKVTQTNNIKFSKFAADGYSRSIFAFDLENNLWAWGYNKGSLLANASSTTSTTPTQITGIKSEYTVTFMNGTETVKTEIVEEGNNATAPELTKAGYTLTWDTDFSNVTSDLTVKAIWTANTNTAYKVQHYKQNTSLSGYTLAETESKTGTTGAVAVATAKTYTGFTENTSYSGRVETGNVAGDGSLVLKLYYDRNSYNVTLNTNEGTINSGNVTSYIYGVGATLPTNVTKTGYTFGGWYANSSFTGSAVTSISTTDTGSKTYYAKWTMDTYIVTFKDGETTEKTETVNYGSSATAPELTKAGYTLSWDKDFSNITSDLTVNAVWTANTDTSYKVEHYLRTTDTEVEGYDLYETENLTGTTDTEVTAIAKSYEGFTENTTYSGRVSKGTIVGDGSLVLKLYYNRNSYNITYELNGGTSSSELTSSYTYGKGLILSNRVTKQGYEFAGWYDNSELTGDVITSIGETEIGDKTFYAKWTRNEFTVTFKNGEQTVKTQVVNVGKAATAPSLTKVGYSLSWDKDFSNVTSDLTVNAVWTANTNTAYKVEHYLRTTDTEVEGYNLYETENLTGTTDTEVTAIAKSYEGFTENTTYSGRITKGTIAGDGSLVLKLYYNRNSYNITYELNGGTVSSQLTNSYIYGKGLILSNRVTKQGYVFAGWYDNEECTGDTITSIDATEIGDKTFYAKWTSAEQYYITSEKHSINVEENQITKVSPNTNVEALINNLNTNGTAKILNAKGEEITGTTLVGTGYKLQIEYKGEKYEYEIAVRGDLDGNGKVTITDLSTLNQIFVKKLTVTGVREKAADIDYSNKITITDLSKMNQALARKAEL